VSIMRRGITLIRLNSAALSTERIPAARPIEAITETTGIIMPPMPIPRINGSGTTIIVI